LSIRSRYALNSSKYAELVFVLSEGSIAPTPAVLPPQFSDLMVMFPLQLRSLDLLTGLQKIR